MMVALYSRVSTQDQAKEGYSIGEQNERLKAYAAAMGWTVYKSYVDPAFSGANTNRPALQEMIKDIQAGHVKKVVVYKLDRLSRSQLDILYLIEKVFLANGCDFVSMSENFDTSSPFGRAMIGILAVFAQLEREQIKERMTMGRDARAKDGKWRGGGNVPMGYDYVDGELIVNEEEAAQIRELFSRYTSGTPMYTLLQDFNDRGLTIRGRQWRRTEMKYVLGNGLYAGMLRHREMWEKGLQEPIISLDTYEKAKRILDANNDRYFKAGYKNGQTAISTYLGGLIYCAHCGAKYTKFKSGSKKYGFHYNYKCYSRTSLMHMVKDKNCKNKTYRIDELDEIVFSQIRKLAMDDAYFQSMFDKKKPTATDDTSALKKQIARAESQVSRFLDLYGTGRFDMAQLDAKIAPLQAQIANLRAQMEKESVPAAMPQENALLLVKSFADVLENGTLQEARQIIFALIKRIDIDGDTVTIHWAFL